MRPLHCVSPLASACRVWCVVVLVLGILLGTGKADAGPARDILRVRHFTAPDHTRIVIDLTGAGPYEIQHVHAPERIAINIPGARFLSTATTDVGDSLVRRIRCNRLSTRAQVVLDLQGTFPVRDFALRAADGLPDRIVVDVLRPEPQEALPDPGTAPTLGPAEVGRPFIVVLDPGHGGLDPGAVRGGVQEKTVVLRVAKELASAINDLPGYRAVLTRDGDYYPSLGQRVRAAQKAKGDLFISIHCNTHRKSAISGMEVYFLSLQGATDREAQELADKENAADLIGLAPEDTRDDSVMSILLDLRMTQVLHQSNRLSERILSAARNSRTVGARKVKQARFQVLRSLAMPSALVELAYLSNRQDRKLLASQAGVGQLARILLRGILDYRGDREALAAVEPASGWPRTYKVRRGDTLWELARRHRTTISEIREHNNLRSASIQVGQMLRLPEVD